MNNNNTNRRGFVVVEGVKICRITPEGKLAFLDRDRQRCHQRGSREVVISMDELRQRIDKGD